MQSYFPLLRLLAIAALLPWAALAIAQEKAATQTNEKADRLTEMKRQAAEYEVEVDGRTSKQLTLHDEPILRFDNPVGGVPDGIVVMWKEGSRPAVFAQVFQTADKLWVHECQSLASSRVTMSREGKVVWQPKEAAGRFHPLGESPALGDTPAKRLSQLRSLAKQFSAADDFKVRASDVETTRHELRRLPTPVYRYEDVDNGVDEGAVFAFVHGTDAELFLVLEHRRDSGAWQYALAPMTCWAVEVKRDNAVVWSVPERLGKSKPTGDYHVWIYRPEPKP